jgi:hypothetical protein
MGAGCYYTHNCNKERAAWVDLYPNGKDTDDDDADFEVQNTFGYIANILMDLGYNNQTKLNVFCNGLFEVHLEYTYYGDGLIIRLEPLIDYDQRYNLAMANHHRAEKRILRTLCKEGFKLRIATSGYTATDLIVK